MSAPRTPSYRGSNETIKPGDIVAIMVHTYRNGEVTGSRVAVQGEVYRIYRHGDSGYWRANMAWEDKVKAFLYTGKNDWAFVHELTLIKRGTVAKL